MATAANPLTPERVVRQLEWRVLRRLDGRLQGNYRTLFRGNGVDFRDLREYVPGDDVRHIDWNVTARMDTPFVRQYAEDRDVTAWLLLDRSPSMSFGPPGRSKDVVLAELATTLARVFVRGGNRVGALLYNDALERTVPARSGRHQVLRLAGALSADTTESSRVTDLANMMSVARSAIRRRSAVVVMSDFIGRLDWERPLGILAQRHDVVAIRIVDPRESELPDVGWIVVEDAESGEQLHVDTSDPVLRRRLADAAAEQDRMIAATARRAGAELHLLSTDEDLAAGLLRIVRRRTQRSRR